MFRILVTGANGFIGKSVMRQLSKEKDVQVLGVTRSASKTIDDYDLDENKFGYVYCDITLASQVRRLINLYQPTHIFHLAANAIVKEDANNPTDITKTNVLGTHNILSATPEHCRFVFASSATVYGDSASVSYLPANEGARTRPSSVYGATKLAGESLVCAYGKTRNINPISLRFVANVGGDATHGLLLDVVKKLYGPSPYLELLGSEPGSVKPFIHVDDTADAILYFGLDFEYTGVVNICTQNSISVEQVATVAMETLGISKPIKWLGNKANWKGDDRLVYISDRLCRVLGWEPRDSDSIYAVQRATKELASIYGANK